MAQAIEYDLTDADLIAAAAHELKNPLAFINSAASVLGDDSILTPHQRQKYLERICLSAERMLSIVDSLLGARKLRSGRRAVELSPTNPNHAITEIISELKAFSASRQQQIRFSPKKTLKPVLIDRDAFHHALYNLIDNAIKYSPIKSKIAVELKRTSTHLQVKIISPSQKITSEDWRRLHNQFSQSDQPITAHADSNGLGLIVATQLVRLMSGYVGFYAREGKNCFYIAVPLTDQLSLFR